jgi:formylglycine-generating enzyme required for sulfatase activity
LKLRVGWHAIKEKFKSLNADAYLDNACAIMQLNHGGDVRFAEFLAAVRRRIPLPGVAPGKDVGDLMLIPAGEFWMGSGPGVTDGVEERERPRHRVSLDAYYIDQVPVTNARFERFVKETGYQTTAEWEGGARVWRQQDGTWHCLYTAGATWRAPSGPGSVAPPNHPVVQVSWQDAKAYGHWAGKRLPTEAEWEKAARGAGGRAYPWGEAWDGGRANGDKTIGKTSPVGSYPNGVSPYGVEEMAGNVREWVSDWYEPTYYRRSPTGNPRGPESGERRVVRGGSWYDSPHGLRTSARQAVKPGHPDNTIGFRCAMEVPGRRRDGGLVWPHTISEGDCQNPRG